MGKTTNRMWATWAVAFCFCAVVLGVGSSLPAARAETTALLPTSRGQIVYVPAYSHVYLGDREHPFDVTVMLSVRNTDTTLSLRLLDVQYRGSDGRILRKLVKNPLSLGPSASARYVIPESDKTGGSGASFLVTWRADRALSPPLLESVMIGTQLQQGISFTSRGQVIKELSD